MVDKCLWKPHTSFDLDQRRVWLTGMWQLTWCVQSLNACMERVWGHFIQTTHCDATGHGIIRWMFAGELSNCICKWFLGPMLEMPNFWTGVTYIKVIRRQLVTQGSLYQFRQPIRFQPSVWRVDSIRYLSASTYRFSEGRVIYDHKFNSEYNTMPNIGAGTYCLYSLLYLLLWKCVNKRGHRAKANNNGEETLTLSTSNISLVLNVYVRRPSNHIDLAPYWDLPI